MLKIETGSYIAILHNALRIVCSIALMTFLQGCLNTASAESISGTTPLEYIGPIENPSSNGASAGTHYDAITIVSPAKDQTVFDNNGNVDVMLTLLPPLKSNDRLVLFFDGLPSSQDQTSIRLSNVERGLHSLQAKVLDNNGNTLIASDIITFHMWHASRLFPHR